MNTIVLASLKGGVGKTTHAAHLAVALDALNDGPVVCMDLDPQGTFADWWNDRKAETPIFAKVEDYTELEAKQKKLAKAGFKWLIIDTPPQTADINREAIRLADMVIIPCKHGKGDIKASLSTVRICEELKQPFYYLLNESKGKRAAEVTVKKMAAFGKVMPQVIPNLNGYWQSMYTGQTLTEQTKGTGAILIHELAQFVVERFDTPVVQEKAYA
ncbi:ParA family protein [Caballeronia sp. LZ034LL]|uniref:ParA family protein n=1 Tax=Caballeronia sp. LZ034LL TaxID=3038567 RepID=UPI002860B98B|nr:ParA family protein [Caballeronia sp. LZ034LL]MDR5839352.1 ParA family protein [Caballeronia sp. LZ034LL]